MSTSIKELDKLFENELYLYFYNDFLDPERTKQECTFIQKCCALKSGDKILDLACGHGRHANFLTTLGYPTIGIDLNHPFIEQAKLDAQKEGLTTQFIEQDILAIDYQAEFDTILFLFNSLGFFDRKDAKLLLTKISRALKIGGTAFIDTKNRDHLIKELQPCTITEKGQDLMIDRLSFDPIHGTTTNKRIYIKDGERFDAPYTMTAYSYTDFLQLLKETGLKIIQTWGSWRGDSFNQDSRRIIFILEKIA